MPPLKFSKSEEYLKIDPNAEAEILDAYAETLDDANVEDIYLKHLPIIFQKLHIPHCFTRDIDNCVQWFYDTQFYGTTGDSNKARASKLLLQQLTLSRTHKGELEVSDVVDIDKLIIFGNRLVKFRDHFPEIKKAWRLFIEASGEGKKSNDSELLDAVLTLKDLQRVKGVLGLDDVSDSILIDMLGCGTTTLDGQVLNYDANASGLAVGIKDFAEILGQIGQLE